MKRIIKKIGVLLVILSMLVNMAQIVSADSLIMEDPPIICKDNLKYTKKVVYQQEENYVIAKIRNVSGTVKIPDYVTFDHKKYPVKVIGTTGNNTKTTQVVLPKTAARVQEKTFCRFTKLKKIQVEKGSKNFKCANNMLLSKSGKTLYAIPSVTADTLNIPQGVKTLASWSCANRNIKTVFLPKGMKSVGANAFYNDEKLKNIYYTYGDKIKYGKNAYDRKKVSLTMVMEDPTLNS